MPARTIDVQTADGPMALYDATPDGDAKGAVIVIQEAFGVNEHIEDVTRRFAAAGYHAVAPHVFHRSGGGSVDYTDFGSVLPHFEALSDEKFLMDVDAAIAFLREAGWSDEQIGIVGFCMGGRVTFLVAARRALGGAVGFYGGGIVTARFPQFPALIDSAATIKTPFLGLFGDLDQGIPIDDVERLRDEMKAAPVDSDVVRYADAEHGFHCDRRPAYNEAAAKDGWRRTLEWFDGHLAGT
jgi:carboxymethylenebutenolidase